MKTGRELMNALKDFPVANGKMAYCWLGQMSLVVKAADAMLYFDLFLTPQPDRIMDPLLKPEELCNADYIFGSHDHSDHIDRKAWPKIAEASPLAKFVAPAVFADGLAEELGIPRERIIGVDENQGYEDGRIRIQAVPSAHEFLDKDPKTGMHPYLGYVVTTSGGVVYHPGDCCLYEGLQTALKACGPIDLLILPVNGRDGRRYRRNCIGNMTFQEAADLAGALRPGLAIPGHYETIIDNGTGADAAGFLEMLEAKYPGQNTYIPPHGEMLPVPGKETR